MRLDTDDLGCPSIEEAVLRETTEELGLVRDARRGGARRGGRHHRCSTGMGGAWEALDARLTRAGELS